MNVRSAIKLVFREKAVIMDATYGSYSAEEWRERADSTGKRVIRTPNKSFVIPEVIRLLEFDQIINKPINLTRQNVFLRDDFKCQYCGISTDLTLDHIIPKSRGEEFKMTKREINSWENITTCCKKCNNSKDNKTLEEAGLTINNKPYRPTYDVLGLDDEKNCKPSWDNYIRKRK